jgi:peroxiredoxin Q/BCP
MSKSTEPRAEVAIGKRAPAFTLQTDEGKTVSLDDFRGRTVVLYFYPKDDTTTCTQQACEFRDQFPRFTKSGAVILGISPDSVASHVKFKRKYQLPFTLLADDGHAVADRYGVWKLKKRFGVTYMGVVRTTFVIDGDGVLRAIVPVPKLAGHIEKVEEIVKGMRKAK